MGERSLAAEVARLRQRLDRIEKGQRVAHGAAIENAALTVRDGAGSLRAIVGQQADGTSGVNVVNGPTPPTPSLPVVTPALGALTVAWDGKFTDAMNAPLDWMRCEVHVGPDAGFTPDQGTLRDTIETAQGGSVVVPLPYTAWWVKLRSRTAAGVAGAATAGVSGTPRKTEAADIAAGAITAASIAVDALTGKTITGGTITGATVTGSTVTGGTVRTGSTGQRVVLTPTGGESGNRPAAQFYSGLPFEVRPGEIAAYADDAQEFGFMEMRAPDFISGDFDSPASLYLQSGTGDTTPVFLLSSGDSNEGGFVSITGNGSTAAPDGTIEMLFSSGAADIATFDIGHNGFEFDNWEADHAPLEYRDGVFTTPNIVYGTTTVTPSAANTPTSYTIGSLNLPGTTFRAYVTAATSVPGANPSGGAVLGVGATNASSTGCTLWVTRTNTTNTVVNWMIVGA